MATFETNFFSYARGRFVTIHVLVPTAGWFEQTYTPAMGPTLNMDHNDFTTTLDLVPYCERFNYVDHKPKAKYPVLYILSGGAGDRFQWIRDTQIEMFCEERKIALVSVDGESAEWHMDRDIEFLVREVRELVCGMFPVSEDPKDHYIAGMSRGSGGVLHHIAVNPDKWGAFGLLCSSMTYYEDNPIQLFRDAAAAGAKFPPAYVSIGDKDHGVSHLEYTRNVLKEGGVDVTWKVEPGFMHGYRFCNVAIEKFLDWLPRKDYYADKPAPSDKLRQEDLNQESRSGHREVNSTHNK